MYCLLLIFLAIVLKLAIIELFFLMIRMRFNLVVDSVTSHGIYLQFVVFAYIQKIFMDFSVISEF